MFEQLGLIGCGLMGGSFALALKKAGLVQRVVGYSKSPTTTARALQMGVIDVEAPSALLAAAGADLVLLAVPVGATEATLKSIKHLVTPETLIMDVGSTKADVVQAARNALGSQIASFVPAHPNTGKEVAGVEHADAELYRGAKVILTPTERTLTSHLHKAEALWQALGCDVRSMSPETHDAAFATVSHLPHMLAFAMMHSVIGQPQADAFLSVAGPGFRDFTRIAAGDPAMWRDILLANKDEVLAQAQHFQRALQAFEQALHTGDAQALEAMITLASTARAQCRFLPPAATTPTA
ncbi:prephenate dehydrogenase/arogenate dehydrogenase family protein [Comamonas aquatica]|uniref:Prephenate dehydrogenase/arogenate dehydrogenase family protein n=1 Tax=Comamonas aquatica TaxID=225991 RepID=A0AA42L8K7_9BURK|nr:prephenate dehydrogenase/arogenate dehydrogenase family protein [Comamonas aquatica]MDH0200528.1 prephenate dehydrogenase/arogenate dehydrogenase family protein [Comamonas aquatica]MDH0364681.1 prephenate dehydrogenase/arogenate dehydrogenase family protein [Comamonas aquatica]MDH0495215.1 prephenate dehydrogenase/arogenate dehydrogenase family protein [Comamonas aquatica]MDH1428137.1 prephenate dehydrogenase/arogenate dehydrogenase family protein [Comamonas aquatica]MDH1447129.1 prephenate